MFASTESVLTALQHNRLQGVHVTPTVLFNVSPVIQREQQLLMFCEGPRREWYFQQLWQERLGAMVEQEHRLSDQSSLCSLILTVEVRHTTPTTAPFVPICRQVKRSAAALDPGVFCMCRVTILVQHHGNTAQVLRSHTCACTSRLCLRYHSLLPHRPQLPACAWQY